MKKRIFPNGPGTVANAWVWALALIVFGSSGRAQELPGPNPELEPRRTNRTLTVGGQGEVLAAPDQALVRVGAEANADDAAAAQDKINSVIHKALERIRKVGIPDNAIQTTGLFLAPVYGKPTPEGEAVTGYRASNVIQIRVDDLGLLGKVIDAAVAAGANRLEGVSFQLKHDLPERTRALKMAVQEAHAKAQAMADALDVQLGPVDSVSEQGVAVMPRPQVLGMERTLARSTPVQPGEIRVQASVQVRYRLADHTQPGSRAHAAEAAAVR